MGLLITLFIIIKFICMLSCCGVCIGAVIQAIQAADDYGTDQGYISLSDVDAALDGDHTPAANTAKARIVLLRFVVSMLVICALTSGYLQWFRGQNAANQSVNFLVACLEVATVLYMYALVTAYAYSVWSNV
ncbi:unnamed protein product [Vitrella brassicaformis CCMP3155]|uniref:Uncharacterized protein n=1 Tax=Vitrella brassicaformis (strain CCMP3155) TaxID=1169540 RepID=A0A0G4GM33_VITBC|nr:unnamed protein product [Vitrella brassicaformis CCMP3155]|eukprot:CEM31217.1 unnamed protein product [Vitrella brassicaformis CCMP3155]